jgi:hypothetical protein
MSVETTYAGLFGSWRQLDTALTANAAELAHLNGLHTRLLEVLSETQEVLQQQAAFTAGKLEASRRLKNLMTEGERLANLLRQALKQHYGIRSEKLAEFGLQPFRGLARAAKPAPETPSETTPVPAPVNPAGPVP